MSRMRSRGVVAGVLVWGFVAASGGAPPAGAEICAIDPVPAATLLLPYFEVDLDVADGLTTLMAVGNARPEPTLAKVTLWTDLAVPTISFDLYLTGFDVATLNLRDVLVGGVVPGEAPSPSGPLSLPNTPFEGCTTVTSQTISPRVLAALRNAHLGAPTALYGGLCAGGRFEDRVARGFITVDVVERCSLLLPGQPGYFGSDGIAGYDNVLWGDFFYLDPANDFAQGESLVRLEASQERFGPGAHTFYGFMLGGSGADAREPLPPLWSTRYLQAGPFGAGTDVVVWHAPHEPMVPFDCSETFLVDPPLLPISELYAFDEEENPELLYPSPGILDPPPPPGLIEPFPNAANRRPLADLFYPPVYDFGWLAIDLRGRFGHSEPNPRSQAWVGSTYSASGRFSVGLVGTAIGSGCEPGSACSLGYPQRVGRLCVEGTGSGLPPGPTNLEVGGSAVILVSPDGCFSSSCTYIYSAGCRVVEQATPVWSVEASFCLAEDRSPGAACTADCRGTEFSRAQCIATGLEAGTFSVVAGDLSVTFTVPSTIPAGGLCDEL